MGKKTGKSGGGGRGAAKGKVGKVPLNEGKVPPKRQWRVKPPPPPPPPKSE